MIFFLVLHKILIVYRLEPPFEGSSNDYSQSMFRIKNTKNMYTPVYSSFTMSKWGSRGNTFHGRFPVGIVNTVFHVPQVCAYALSTYIQSSRSFLCIAFCHSLKMIRYYSVLLSV